MKLLRNRDFALLTLGLVIVQGSLPFQLVAPIFWVQENAGDDSEVLLVGVLSMFRGVAMVGFGMYGGTLADRFDRRLVLIVAAVGGLVVAVASVAVVAVGEGGPVSMGILFGLVFCGAAVWAIDIPTRQSMIPDIVGMEVAQRGLALATSVTWFLSTTVLIAVGLLIDKLGFTGAFALVACVQVVVLLSLLPMAYRRTTSEPDVATEHRSGFRDLRDGIAYAWSQPVLRFVVGVSILMTGIASPAISGLGPTWITTVIGVSFTKFGLIGAVWAFGALTVSMLLARHTMPARMGPLFAAGAILFASGFFVFGLQAAVPFAIVGNAGAGSGLIATQILGVGLIAQIAPNEMRGRVTSLLLMDRALAQLLALPAAAVGQLIGLTTLFPVLGVTCLSVVLLMVVTQRRVWMHPFPSAA